MSEIKTDILIVGAGISGISAAIAAAAENKSVLVIDKNEIPGGNSTLANVGTICGAFYRNLSGHIEPVGYQQNRAFVKEIAAASDSNVIHYHQGLYILPYKWEALKNLFLDKIESAGIDISFHTKLKAVNRTNDKIDSIDALCKEQELLIKADKYIDCTGNGALGQMAGNEMIKEEEYQLASQVFTVRNIQSDNEFSLNLALKLAAARLEDSCEIGLNFYVVPGSLQNQVAHFKYSLEETITDDDERNQALNVIAKNRIKEAFPMVKSEVESLKAAEISYISPQLGLRVLQRCKGDYVLNEQDIMQAKMRKDGIARGTWPIEEWLSKGKLNMQYFEDDTCYWIPAACLSNSKIKNLWFAGKNISASHKAIASARVMGTCIQTAYAAAKLACSENPSKTIEQLNDELNQ